MDAEKMARWMPQIFYLVSVAGLSYYSYYRIEARVPRRGLQLIGCLTSAVSAVLAVCLFFFMAINPWTCAILTVVMTMGIRWFVKGCGW
jgi:hypothetical protein